MVTKTRSGEGIKKIRFFDSSLLFISLDYARDDKALCNPDFFIAGNEETKQVIFLHYRDCRAGLVLYQVMLMFI